MYTTRRMPADIRSVRVPTLMIHGEQRSARTGVAGRATSRRRPDWTLEVFDDCGHVPQIEQPERFVAVTADWLEELPHPATALRRWLLSSAGAQLARDRDRAR